MFDPANYKVPPEVQAELDAMLAELDAARERGGPIPLKPNDVVAKLGGSPDADSYRGLSQDGRAIIGGLAKGGRRLSLIVPPSNRSCDEIELQFLDDFLTGRDTSAGRSADDDDRLLWLVIEDCLDRTDWLPRRVGIEHVKVARVILGTWDIANNGYLAREHDAMMGVADRIEARIDAHARQHEDTISVPSPSRGRTGDPPGPKQARMRHHLQDDPPFILLDGKPFATFDEFATRYVARLIDADGEYVSFTDFKRKNPGYESMVSTRVLDSIPDELAHYIERNGKGKPCRLKVELLR